MIFLQIESTNFPLVWPLLTNSGNQRFVERRLKEHMNKHTKEGKIEILKEKPRLKSNLRDLQNSILNKSNAPKQPEPKSTLFASKASNQQSSQKSPQKKKFSEQQNRKTGKKGGKEDKVGEKVDKKAILKGVDQEAVKAMKATEVVRNEANEFSLLQYLLVKQEQIKAKEKENLNYGTKKGGDSAERDEEDEGVQIDPNSLAANIIKSIKDKPIKRVLAKQKIEIRDPNQYQQ